MTVKKKGLGRGLDALLRSSEAKDDPGAQLRDVSLELIHPSPFQPRKHFDEDALRSLADSIRAQGLIAPVVLRRRSGEYELIAGERRWRAAQLAGLQQIPAIVRDIDDHQAAALALIENLQREDLDPIEQAEAMRRLIKEFEMTHQQVADILGISRPVVSNALRLLDLAEPVRQLLQNKQLDAGHARALAGLPMAQQPMLAEKIVAKALTVRQVEGMVRKLNESALNPPEPIPADPDTALLLRQISDALGVQVDLVQNARGGGRLKLRFDQPGQLDRILNRLLQEQG
ncbi:ParB/RepB/Spo0J family partition protein [Halothiobacillus sp.]|jgi:ParB family chromosome partitioning protein|uniref:ParB/RepB/Spo0J family partition protein n=1 Tax=Halothiobacillus sp. TaxID=1891311 RepID=UPI00260B4E05|nr:ParB/RepB/Spo0J family partition protein [Halothiobacillus sp.]MDD4966169.1 ParB/RepB/Spo0J family partition protein [Halothiobacillus sp.]MDY0148135.1 ParB/RepB/Spo0J family partition protein [Halothiobacillus sp.]